MLSSYRLGDLVMLELNELDKNEILTDYPHSFASKYIFEKRKNPKRNNIEAITQIVLNHIENVSTYFPSDIVDSTVIHLRLGDVVAGNQWHEKIKRPLTIEHLQSIVAKDTNPKYVLGKCFFAKPSSKNYQECIHLSHEYLNNVLITLNAKHFDSGNADIDLCCAIRSKLFIQGRGFFSKLIVEIRKKLNLPSIETSAHD
jgi:hypothetical protein